MPQVRRNLELYGCGAFGRLFRPLGPQECLVLEFGCENFAHPEFGVGFGDFVVQVLGVLSWGGMSSDNIPIAVVPITIMLRPCSNRSGPYRN